MKWLVSRLALAAFGTALNTPAALPPKAPVPPSPFLAVVYRYADTMLARGRDTYGPDSTGLFLSALDRVTLAPLTRRPPGPAGLSEAFRVGAPAGPLGYQVRACQLVTTGCGAFTNTSQGVSVALRR